MVPKMIRVVTAIVTGLVLVGPGSRDGVRLVAGESQQSRTGKPSHKDEATELGKLAAAMKPGSWAEL